MTHALLFLLSLDSFDARQTADELYRAAWPLSAPLALAGASSSDPEIRHRCRRMVAELGPGLPHLGRAFARPSALLKLLSRTPPGDEEDAEDAAAIAAFAAYFRLVHPSVMSGCKPAEVPRVVWALTRNHVRRADK